MALAGRKLGPFKPYLAKRMRASAWNARVLLRELQQRRYVGSHAILTDWLRPQRESPHTVVVRRVETPADKQDQVDWDHLSMLEMGGKERKIWGFTFTLAAFGAVITSILLMAAPTAGSLFRKERPKPGEGRG